MKRIHLICLFALVLVGGACSHKSETLSFALYEYEEDPFTVNEDTLGIRFSIKIQLPDTKNIDGDKLAAMNRVKDTILRDMLYPYYRGEDADKAIRNFCDSIRKDFPSYDDLVNDEFSRDYWDNDFCWGQDINVSVKTASEELMSFEGVRVEYYGGPSNEQFKEYFVFDRETGKRLTEKDIFKSENYDATIKAISKLLQKELNKILEKPEEIGIMDESIEDIDWESVVPNGNFNVTPNGLVYFYDLYEIGPRSVGCYEVPIANFELKEYLNEKSVLYKYWFKK